MTKWHSSLGIPEGQWRYLRHWLILILITEVLMVIFNHYLSFIYLIIGMLFFGGFVLRVFRKYPGEDEPLILDFSALCLSLCYVILASFLEYSLWRFLLIFCSSGIIVPHLIYIINEK